MPHIELNISVSVHEYVDFVIIRLQCVYAPDAEDIYCHDAQRMMSEGQCFLSTLDILVFVYLAYHSIWSMLRYLLKIVGMFLVFAVGHFLKNSAISSTLLITSPSDVQLYPAIAEYYANEVAVLIIRKEDSCVFYTAILTFQGNADLELSPLLIIDFSDEDGVWLRVGGPASQKSRVITISIFGRDDGVLHPLHTFSITHPATGLKVSPSEL
ncbi:unnamed protein product [Strongylus vulgaris]|uniref:Uncharacterized protein n=1 Tax=Strongylus vulgaris TaxID=40348 RepID=A0A3P7IW72_STRVU|nr:unnamed protein product [Strongylus vulgaris]